MNVGIDARYLLGPRRGIGQGLFYLFKHLAAIEEHGYVLFYNHFRPMPAEDRFPCDRPNVTERCFRWPTHLLDFFWKRFPFPKVEFFTGEIDLFHSPILHVVPPTRCPTVVTLHDFAALRFPHHYPDFYVRKYKRSLRMVERRADRIIAVSNSTKTDIMQFMAIPEDRISVVHRGVDPTFHPMDDLDAIDHVLARLNLQRGYVLYAGGTEPHKNLDRVIEAYSRLPGEVRERHALVFAGSLSWGHERLQEQAASMGVEQRVLFPGYVPDEDMLALYNGAALVTFPSLCEGFGYVAVEAMACGIPVVVSNVTSLPEVVGDAGLLVDPENTDELADATRRGLTDAALRADLRERGLRRVKDLTWGNTARETVRVYAEASRS